MEKSQTEREEELIHVSRERCLASCRGQLIEEGKLAQDEQGRYFLTEKGIKTAEKELSRYAMRPAMAVMIEQYYLQMHDILVE